MIPLVDIVTNESIIGEQKTEQTTEIGSNFLSRIFSKAKNTASTILSVDQLLPTAVSNVVRRHPATKIALATATTCAALGLSVLAIDTSNLLLPTATTCAAVAGAALATAAKTNLVQNYLSKFSTRITKPLVNEIPIIPRVAGYAAGIGVGYTAPIVLNTIADTPGCVIGEAIKSFNYGVVGAFALGNLLGYIKRADKNGDDDDDEDDDDPIVRPNWIGDKNGPFGTIETIIDEKMAKPLSLIQDETGVPYSYTVRAIQGSITAGTGAAIWFWPGAFIAKISTDAFRKFVKRETIKSPLGWRWSAHAVALGSTAFLDYAGVVKWKFSVFQPTADLSFALLAVDAKKAMNGKFEKSTWFSCTKQEKVKATERQPPALWKRALLTGTTAVVAGFANACFVGSLAAQYSTEVFTGAIKPAIKQVCLLPRYVALPVAVGAGYVVEHYTPIPAGTVLSGLAVNSAIADITAWLYEKQEIKADKFEKKLAKKVKKEQKKHEQEKKVPNLDENGVLLLNPVDV